MSPRGACLCWGIPDSGAGQDTGRGRFTLSDCGVIAVTALPDVAAGLLGAGSLLLLAD